MVTSVPPSAPPNQGSIEAITGGDDWALKSIVCPDAHLLKNIMAKK